MQSDGVKHRASRSATVSCGHPSPNSRTPEVQRQPNVQKNSLNHSRFSYYFLFLHGRDIRKIKNLEILEDLCVHWVAVVPKTLRLRVYPVEK